MPLVLISGDPMHTSSDSNIPEAAAGWGFFKGEDYDDQYSAPQDIKVRMELSNWLKTEW